VVLHAPTRRLQKGSAQIEEAVSRLIESGAPVRYETLTGLPTSAVRARLADADVVVDQLWSDTLFAGLSSEGGVAGALPLVFGYPSDLLRPMAERLGIPCEHFGPPEELEQRLERAITDPEWRESSAEKIASYLRAECGPVHVAAKLARVITDDVPDEWWVDPAGVVYLEGYGMSRETAALRLGQYVARYGVDALHLPAGSAVLARAVDVIANGSNSRSSGSGSCVV
jgi:hypothetical protein